jgi:Adenylate and Guanylate cyclase catalytic domain
VMGDGIMALFGASIAHEDHAVRACYAALAMQDAIRRYSEEVRRAQGLEVQIRVGLNSGESALFPSGDFGRVLVYLRKAESLAEAIDDSRRLGQVSNFLSVHFYRMGAYDQSVAAAQRVLVLALAMVSGEVVLHALANLRLGIAYHAQGEYRRAIDAFTQTVTALDGAQRRERLGQVNLPAVLSRACLAACHAELGTFTEGRAPGDEGMRIAEVVDHPASLMVALWGSVCWPCAKATCPGPSPSSNGP